MKKLVGGKAEVTEDDLRKAYESSYGERVEALAIVVGDNRQAQKVWEMARNQPTDAFFAELAQQYSIELQQKLFAHISERNRIICEVTVETGLPLLDLFGALGTDQFLAIGLA